MMRHVTSLLVNVVLVDYILPEFCHCLIFLFKKIGAGFYSPTPNIIEPFFPSPTLFIVEPKNLGKPRFFVFAWIVWIEARSFRLDSGIVVRDGAIAPGVVRFCPGLRDFGLRWRDFSLGFCEST